MEHFNSHKHYWLRYKTFVVCSILSLHAFSQVFTVDSIMKNGRRNNRVNFAYMADGYKNTQLDNFIVNTNTINDALFATTPFKEYKNYFNAFAIRVPSTESGAKHPATASDEPVPAQAVANPNNYFQSTFDFGSIHRLLVPQNNAGLTGVLAANLPDYNQAFVVANSPFYGGSGGQYATASTDPNSAEVAIHEIGHSFAGLADEYWAGPQYATEKPNMTANNDAATVKWKNWLNINGIGIYSYGAAAPLSSWYRPHQNCKMQFLGSPFCSVCTERFLDVIHQRVNMIDDFLPTSTSFSLTNTSPVFFSVTRVTTSPNTVNAKWYLNNNVYASNQSSISIPYSSFAPGNNTVRAEVIDNTTLSKSYLPGVGYISSTTWTVSNSRALPLVLKSFSGLINNKAGVLNWDVDNSEDVESFELGKSKDGISFSPLTTVANQQNKKQYSFSDPALLAPYTYYRLKIISKDGAAILSPVIRLQDPFDNFVYKVYQNAELHRYHLLANLTNFENVSIALTDAVGKILLRKDFGKMSGQLDYNIELAGQPGGLYFLKININNSNYTVQLLAK